MHINRFTFWHLQRYYARHGSQMHVVFLDASRAFDRLNHVILLSKLVKFGVPLYIVRIVALWYSSQLYFGWGISLSVGFTVSNGVRQGGILSPLLFNFYMNDLSVVLRFLLVVVLQVL